MNLKTVVAGLIGLVIGVAGYYLVARRPNVIEPSTPSNLALMFGQDVNSNAAYPAKSLMTAACLRARTGRPSVTGRATLVDTGLRPMRC